MENTAKKYERRRIYGKKGLTMSCRIFNISRIKMHDKGDFPGGPVGRTPSSQCKGPEVQSLVRELGPACMPQLRSPHATTKILHAATKTWRSQNKFFKRRVNLLKKMHDKGIKGGDKYKSKCSLGLPWRSSG